MQEDLAEECLHAWDRRGVHCIVPKWMFNMSDTTPYAPKTFTGTSKPANVTMLTSL